MYVRASQGGRRLVTHRKIIIAIRLAALFLLALQVVLWVEEPVLEYVRQLSTHQMLSKVMIQLLDGELLVRIMSGANSFSDAVAVLKQN